MTASDVREKEPSMADLAAAMKYHGENHGSKMPGSSKLEIEAFLAGIQHARSEQAQLVEALEDAVDGMTTMVDDLNHCFEERCVPIEGEVVSARSHLGQAREALAGWRKK